MEGTGARISSAELNNVLGTAEKLIVQIRVTKVTGTSPTLLVFLEHSNDGKDWQSPVTLVEFTALNAGSINTIMADSGSTVFGALVRFVVALDGTNPSGFVEIFACGRAEELEA